MESQTIPNLRPLRLGEMLDQAIRLYRSNFLTFVGIIAVVYVPLMVLQTAATTLMSSSMLNGISTSSPEAIFSNSGYWIGISATLIISFIRFVLVQGVATGALTRAVADNYFGRKVGILEAYRGIGRSWLSLLAALLFVGLLIFVAALWWIIIPCVGWFTGLGMIVFLSTVISPLVAGVVVLEGQTALNAVRRAWSLARRRFWPVLGYVFVLALFSVIIVSGPGALINLALTGALQSIGDSTTRLVIVSIIQALVSLVGILIYYPLQMTAFTLIYFDLRVRTEGFDIALQTMQTSEPAGVSQLMVAPPAPSAERLITGPDLGNFAILTLGGVGLYILVFTVITGFVLLIPTLMR
ncbi:MAG: hypothetical protein ABI986_05600 [Chloroflexota bacterium]